MPLATGVRVGPYEVTAKIGAGGMGEVWRARDSKLNRDVALKILPDASDLAGRPTAPRSSSLQAPALGLDCGALHWQMARYNALRRLVPPANPHGRRQASSSPT